MEHGWAGQNEQCCWQACTWLSWPDWTVLLTGLNMVELASLNISWAAQLEQYCWQAWTLVELASLNNVVDRLEHSLSWPAWTVLLTGLNMVELASLNSVVDRLEHGWAGQLEQCCWQACSCISMLKQTVHGLNNVVGTIIINQQPCSFMIEHVVREWWNNKIEQRCYNNHELGCCIKSGFECSNIRKQPLSIRQAEYNMLKHDWTILLFYQSCSIVLTVLLQWYFYACTCTCTSTF